MALSAVGRMTCELWDKNPLFSVLKIKNQSYTFPPRLLTRVKGLLKPSQPLKFQMQRHVRPHSPPLYHGRHVPWYIAPNSAWCNTFYGSWRTSCQDSRAQSSVHGCDGNTLKLLSACPHIYTHVVRGQSWHDLGTCHTWELGCPNIGSIQRITS